MLLIINSVYPGKEIYLTFYFWALRMNWIYVEKVEAAISTYSLKISPRKSYVMKT